MSTKKVARKPNARCVVCKREFYVPRGVFGPFCSNGCQAYFERATMTSEGAEEIDADNRNKENE